LHAAHRDLCLLCSHNPAPPHSLHWVRRRPCSQIVPPLHVRHCDFTRPCSHIDFPPQSLHFDLSLPCPQI
jgi:hypothetical protein